MGKIYHYKNLSLFNIEGEEWRSCLGYDGYYEISNKGRVKSVERTIHCKDGRTMNIKPRILKQAINKKGSDSPYLFVGLSLNCVHHTEEVHRLVGINFLPASDKKCIVHKDHDSMYNIDTNLKWATYEEKGQQAWDIGNQYSVNIGKFGKDSASAKPIKMFDMNGNFIENFGSRIDAAKWLINNNYAPLQPLVNISSCIQNASIGRTKFSYGHKWE